MGDYLSCAVCGCKAIYDADLNYGPALKIGMLHDIAAICGKCSKTHSIQIENKPDKNRVSDFLDDY